MSAGRRKGPRLDGNAGPSSFDEAEAIDSLRGFGEPRAAASPTSSVARDAAGHIRRAAHADTAGIFVPHPDDGYVLWGVDPAPDEPMKQDDLRVWWSDPEPGWRLEDTGFFYYVPLDGGRAGLARVGPWANSGVGPLRSYAIDRAVENATFALREAQAKETQMREGESAAIENAVSALMVESMHDLKQLLLEAIQVELAADDVKVDAAGELQVLNARRSSPLSVAILEDALGKLAIRNDQNARYRTLCALADAVDARAAHTFGHSLRVTSVAEAIIRQFTQDPDGWEIVRMAARLHDVGTSFCGTLALTKVRLDDVERALVQRHPEIGYTMVVGAELAEEVALGVRHHHERWDGTGYPDRLVGPAIPTIAQVIAVAEVFDAMTTGRPWRAAKDTPEALKELAAGAGTQFSPTVVEAFLAMHRPPEPEEL